MLRPDCDARYPACADVQGREPSKPNLSVCAVSLPLWLSKKAPRSA